MQTGVPAIMGGTELVSMAATLCSYENWFGPYHPQTLCLLTELAVAYGQYGDFESACGFLERAIRDVGRNLGRNHEFRLRALAALRDLSIQRRDYEQAGGAQKDLVQSRLEVFGAGHAETLSARCQLGDILLKTAKSEA